MVSYLPCSPARATALVSSERPFSTVSLPTRGPLTSAKASLGVRKAFQCWCGLLLIWRTDLVKMRTARKMGFYLFGGLRLQHMVRVAQLTYVSI